MINKVIKNISPNFKAAEQEICVLFPGKTPCLGMDVDDIRSWGKVNGVRRKAYGGVEDILAHGLREEIDGHGWSIGKRVRFSLKKSKVRTSIQRKPVSRCDWVAEWVHICPELYSRREAVRSCTASQTEFVVWEPSREVMGKR